MVKYKIIQNCGYTHLFIDGQEIPLIQSIKFERKNAKEMAILDIKIACDEAEIEIDEAEERFETKIKKVVSSKDNLDN